MDLGLESRKSRGYRMQRTVISSKSSRALLQVLGSPRIGICPSLALLLDKSRFLFNSGEGIQRALQANKVKVFNHKFHSLFITRLCHHTISGLFGASLSLEGTPMQFCTPRGLKRIFKAGEMFLGSKNRTFIELSDENPYAVFKCDHAQIHAHLISPRKSPKKAKTGPVMLTKSHPLEGFTSAHPGESVILSDQNTQAQPDVIVYILEMFDVRGKFDVKKARELGIAARNFSVLTSGKDIVSEDGTIIARSEDVVGPSTQGVWTLIVDCPTIDHLLRLNEMDIVQFDSILLVVHYSEPSIMQSAEYIGWMQKFPKETQHLYMNALSNNQDLDCVFSDSSNLVNNSLNAAYPEFYPTLAADANVSSGESLTYISSDFNVIYSKNLLSFDLSASAELFVHQRWVYPIIQNGGTNPRDKIREILNSQGESSEMPAALLENSLEDSSISVRFLGTSASRPTKYRNVSSILLEKKDGPCMFIDCGEGSYSQLVRQLGIKGADELISRIECIWLSHRHADHHLGALNIISRKRMLTGFSPIIISPNAMACFWKEMSKYLLDDIVIPHIDSEICSTLSKSNLEEITTFQWQVLSTFDLLRITNIPVSHSCKGAFGLSLEFLDGIKIIYSGDTRPCDILIEHAKDATLLIHEATFDDSQQANAVKKAHSTISEALEVAHQSKAKNTILTHLSARYTMLDDLNYLDKETLNFTIANDFMHVHLRDLPKLRSTLSSSLLALQLFDDDDVEAEP